MTLSTPEQLVRLAGRRVIDVEFMYQPRLSNPTDPRARAVFDVALRSRLAALDPAQDALLLIVNSTDTTDSLQPILAQFPDLVLTAAIANPSKWPEASGAAGDTPVHCHWPTPAQWRRFQQSDRWARIDATLEIASRLDPSSNVILPAHDALWGGDLLPLLLRKSAEYAQNGLPAAVSPYSYYRHSAVEGAAIPHDLIDLMNAAFNRDSSFAAKINSGQMQGFWGKTGLIPCAMGAALRSQVDQTFFEDDSEIDRAIRDLGYATRGIWIDDPAIYRQALPVFDESAARRVIMRTLHYSLPAGGSALLTPLDDATRLAWLRQPQLWAANTRAEALIADCQLEIQARLDQFGASWIDWGAYRYVVRVGDPVVEVWRQ